MFVSKAQNDKAARLPKNEMNDSIKVILIVISLI